MHWTRMALAAVLATAAATAAAAGTITAGPSTLLKEVSRAHSGDVIVLTAGDYPDVMIRDAHFDPPVTLDAHAATLSNFQIRDSSGFVVQGGQFHPDAPLTSPRTGEPAWGAAAHLENVDHIEFRDGAFTGPGREDAATSHNWGEGYGLSMLKGSQVTFSHSTFTGFKVGLVLSQADNFTVRNNEFSAMRADGMDIANSWHGLIEGNHCFGTVIRDGEHPDCVQMWSRPPGPPVSDMVIRKNHAEGPTQGISLFNHVRNGVDDGGFDRIVIEDNEVEISASQGIAIIDGRKSIIRNNHVRTQAGGTHRASINVRGDVEKCGNVTEPAAGKPGVVDGRCPKDKSGASAN